MSNQGIEGNIEQLFQLTPTVVRVHVEFDFLGPVGTKAYATGGGVLVNKTGLVLTCFDVVARPANRIEIEVLSLIGGEQFVKDYYYGEVVHKSREKGLALVKLISDKKGDEITREFDTALFAGEATIHIGMQAVSMNPFVVGHVAYPCDGSGRTPGMLRTDTSHNIKADLEENLRLIQLSNIHVDKGYFGTPVFNTHGRVIGVVIFKIGQFDFAVHSSACQEFCDEFEV